MEEKDSARKQSTTRENSVSDSNGGTNSSIKNENQNNDTEVITTVGNIFNDTITNNINLHSLKDFRRMELRILHLIKILSDKMKGSKIRRL